jgi:pyrroloquinoline quinone (PQQ) biosynthesis protein C
LKFFVKSRRVAKQFERSGPINDLASYPVWAQEMALNVRGPRQAIVSHDLFRLMKEAKLPHEITKNFLLAGWPVIEQFPQYMALNILKIRYGRSRGEDMARRYLLHNIRVEQNHADQWVNWAAACDIPKEALLDGRANLASYNLSHWCWHVCTRENLAVGRVATNYAIEGVTGDWSSLICSTGEYESSFAKADRRRAMSWLKLHAHYDDLHPWEALEIICTLVGNNPTLDEINQLTLSVVKSYEYMRMSLDACMTE